MMGHRFGNCITLCLLPWSCLSFACSDVAGPGTTSPGAEYVRKGLSRDVANRTYVHSSISAPCSALPPPHYGYYNVDRGSGISLGSVLVYWCQDEYQLVGSQKLFSLCQGSTSSWSQPPPYCQVNECLPFIRVNTRKKSNELCCNRLQPAHKAQRKYLHEHLSPPCRQQHGRKVRGGRKHNPSSPERRRNTFGRLKHYNGHDCHLSALSSSVFPGAFVGCDNLAFQRSPQNVPKLSLQSCPPDAPVLPQLVLQPGTPPINAVPSQPARNTLVPAVPLYYRRYEEYRIFNKFRTPV
ncbi:uncharacterized protein [Phaenicophaeus curvirostris]|uniref:uncharacterized protein n=1 Tax=Phaenicophaeus curvirostris TaxID=33595 RepID=UPI0037F0DF06